MTNELQMKLLAEKAGEKTGIDVNVPTYAEERDAGNGVTQTIWHDLPGLDGTLTNNECWTVLGWLLEAEFSVSFIQDDDTEQHDLLIHRLGEYSSIVNVPVYSTPNEALVAAVLALPLEKTTEEVDQK